jgi:hypothetical protein
MPFPFSLFTSLHKKGKISGLKRKKYVIDGHRKDEI